MASGPITSWKIDGETVADFIFGGSKITANGDCDHEIKRHFQEIQEKQKIYKINPKQLRKWQ